MAASSERKKEEGPFTGGELFQRRRRQGQWRWVYVVLERVKA
jgi:hypothetical protein